MVFVAHGAQKLFGWFGGHGLDATIEGFESMGIPPGLTKLAATTEFLGGLGVLTGFLTRPAALGIATVMAVATAKVHWQHGFFVNWGNQPGRGHGIEATMALAGMALSLVISGGGALSVDAALTTPNLRRRRRAATAPPSVGRRRSVPEWNTRLNGREDAACAPCTPVQSDVLQGPAGATR